MTANDSFVSLRGDSLSFVEMSIRLEQNLGHLPHDWPSIRIADLRPAEPRTVSTRPRWRMGWRRIEANIALRTTAIILIVATHLDMIAIQGGAHILLAAAGYNFARFHLTGADRASRLSHLRSSTLSVVVPSMVWIGLAAVLTGAYALHNVFLMNAVFGSPSWSAEWQFWFIEALVTILILTGLLVAIPIFDRLERKAPFAFAMALVALGLIAQYALMPTEPEPTRIYLWHSVVWLFALGWAAAKATGFAQMALVSVIAIAALPGFFDDPVRGAVVAVGVLLLVWVKSIPWPAVLTAATGVVASSSLYIYLTHWQVYPLFEENYPLVGMVASIVVGVAAWKLSKVITKRLSPVFRGEHPHVARAYAPGS